QWLAAPGVQFVSAEAEKLYKQRVTRFIKAIKMEEPDRVPVMLPTGSFPAYYAGSSFYQIMYDYGELKRAWIKFMDDFGDMDTFMGPGLIPSGRILEALDAKTLKWPGHGVGKDVTMQQIVEGEYMKADEYDWLMMDPTDYNLRVTLPRTNGLFEPFKKLPPLRFFIMGQSWVALLADPEIRKVFQTLMDLSDEFKQHQAAIMEVSNISIARGYPSLFGGVMAQAPYDYFADMQRGTKGIVTDLYRQPDKLLEAIDIQLNLTINTTIKNFPMTNCPICMMPLHKGDDAFMSDKQFEKFYWPSLRKLFLAMIEEGLVPFPFAEGRYNNRLTQITDTPKSSVVWYFDQTDMAQAKKFLGNVSCIVGNVPASIVMTGTAKQVKDNCRQLIEICAPGGGYILAGGASIDKGNIENLRAMMEAAYDYGTYK
ncbi:MAG: uroporphyrinogen decarboxylase family protein, partial [Acidobacteriota bacterium]